MLIGFVYGGLHHIRAFRLLDRRSLMLMSIVQSLCCAANLPYPGASEGTTIYCTVPVTAECGTCGTTKVNGQIPCNPPSTSAQRHAIAAATAGCDACAQKVGGNDPVPDVDPTVCDGGIWCKEDSGTRYPATGAAGGMATFNCPSLDGMCTYTIEESITSLGFSVLRIVDVTPGCALEWVVMKASNNYCYYPDADRGGTYQTPLNQQGSPRGLSHISLCFRKDPGFCARDEEVVAAT